MGTRGPVSRETVLAGVRMEKGGAIGEGFFDVKDRWKLLVLHFDETHRLVGCFTGLGRDSRYPLPDVEYAIERQDRPVVVGAAKSSAADVLAGEHGVNPRDSLRCRGVHMYDARMGIRTQEEPTPEHPRK